MNIYSPINISLFVSHLQLRPSENQGHHNLRQYREGFKESMSELLETSAVDSSRESQTTSSFCVYKHCDISYLIPTDTHI